MFGVLLGTSSMNDMMLSSHMLAVDRSNIAVSTLVECYHGQNPTPEEAAFRMPRLKQRIHIN